MVAEGGKISMNVYILIGIVAVIVIVGFVFMMSMIVRLINRVKLLQRTIQNMEEKNTNIHLATQVEKNEQDIQALIEQGYKNQQTMYGIFSRHGIIRYDAFGNVGGKLSFSLAMLDNTDSGFILTSLHQDESSYVFLKEVIKGDTYQDLSDEEKNALSKAKKVIVVDNMEI